MKPEPVFRGIGVALITLFDDNGALDVASSMDHASRLVDLGVKAVVVAGTNGEAGLLTPEERTELIEAVRKAVPSTPLVAGTGASWSGMAAQLTREAVSAGADAVLVMSPPGLTDPSSYFATVAGAAGTTPVMAYHFPRVSSPGIPVELLARLPITGVKDSSGDAERLLQEVAHFPGDTYPGSSALLTLAGAVGATGAILALANADPAICAAAFGGDAESQLRLIDDHLKAKVRTPHGIKELTSARFGTSVRARAD